MVNFISKVNFPVLRKNTRFFHSSSILLAPDGKGFDPINFILSAQSGDEKEQFLFFVFKKQLSSIPLEPILELRKFLLEDTAGFVSWVNDLCFLEEHKRVLLATNAVTEKLVKFFFFQLYFSYKFLLMKPLSETMKKKIKDTLDFILLRFEISETEMRNQLRNETIFLPKIIENLL